jgi:hypothetical protein
MSEWFAADRKHGSESRLSLERQQLISTTAIADAWKDIMHGQWKWLTKMSQRFAPVGKNMHRRGGGGLLTKNRFPGSQQDK